MVLHISILAAVLSVEIVGQAFFDVKRNFEEKIAMYLVY